MTTLPRPDFSKVNSLAYLVQLYHDCVWELTSAPETFSEWLRRMVPSTRELSTSDMCVYVCAIHQKDPESPEQCSVYVCDTHKSNPSSTEPCAPFECQDSNPVSYEVYCMSNILNIHVAHMENFLAHADKYYFALIDLILKQVDVRCIKWKTTPKLCVQLEL